MLRIALIFLLAVSTSIGCSAADNALVKQSLPADPYLWDFGRRREGEVLRHTFVLTNNSQRVMNIGDINTSCGCTASEVKKKVITPGDTLEIETRFNTRGYSGDVKQYIYVHTDDPGQPLIRFTLSAQLAKN